MKLIAHHRVVAIFLLTVASGAGWATTLTVTSAADAGGTCPGATCTLRQALITAAPNDTIYFGLPFGTTKIVLTSAELVVSKSMTIVGPGAKLLSIERSTVAGIPRFRIFRIPAGVTATISGLTIANGIHEYDLTPNVQGGGGVHNTGTLTVTDVNVYRNRTMWGESISGNSYGGGFFNVGILTINNSTVADNEAGFGGGISTGSNTTLNINGSTISGSNTEGIAYMGQVANSVVSTIRETTISGNGSSGIYTFVSSFSLINSTVTANTTPYEWSGGIHNQASVTLKNSIVAGNSNWHLPKDIEGTVTSQGFNFIGVNAGATLSPPGGAAGDQIGTPAAPKDAKLGPLQDNGGPTLTHAPLPTSPVIDAGNAGGSGVDQRGFARPVDSVSYPNVAGGDASDIGAYEVQASALAGCNEVNTVVHNTDDDGPGSLRSVIAGVCAGSTITFDPLVRGAITLTTAELSIPRSMTIAGPGANVLMVKRSAAVGTPLFRIFNIPGGATRVTISGLTITNGRLNTAAGGGILNIGILTLASSAVSGNTVDYSGNGAGIYNSGTMTIDRSTISDNLVGNSFGAASGGGIFNFGATLIITNSTISGNTALGAGVNIDNGGGILTNVGNVSLTNSTVTGNSANTGGGIWNLNGGIVNARNTIIAANSATTGPDIRGSVTSKGFNLVGSILGSSIAPSTDPDQLSVTPAELNLGLLQDNGGPTRTHALLSPSRAIDKGHSSAATMDQRGLARPADLAGVPNASGSDGSDIGAYEVLGDSILDVDASVTATRYDAFTDGVLVLRYLFGLTGASLSANATGATAARSTAAAIKAYLDSNRFALDIDGNGTVDALTDGLLVVRYLFGLRGAVLIQGAIAAGAPRNTAPLIEAYIATLMP